MIRRLLPAALLLAGPALAQDLTFFHTPSGNIHCLGGTGSMGIFVDCEILQRNSPAPLLPKPADCDLDWGDTFTVGEDGPAGMSCHGDTVRDDSGLVLPYGRAISFGAITCVSSENGLECRNGEGHGFFLSRARQAID